MENMEMENVELNLNEMEEAAGGKNNGGYTYRPAARPGRRIYQIQSRDTLIKIAKRFGTTADYLMKINPELTNRNFIVAGCYIYVPA